MVVRHSTTIVLEQHKFVLKLIFEKNTTVVSQLPVNVAPSRPLGPLFRGIAFVAALPTVRNALENAPQEWGENEFWRHVSRISTINWK